MGQTCLNCKYLSQCKAFALGYQKPFKIIKDCPDWERGEKADAEENRA